MADFIHPTTLQVVRSANSPDYPAPWVTPVDLSQVVAVAPKYWKWDSVNLRPIPMSAGEQAAVDAAAQLSTDLAAKLVQILKQSNETRTATTTLADDTNLKATVQPNSKYVFRAHIFFETTAAGDFKWSIGGPASPVAVRIQHACIIPGATAWAGIGVETAFGFGPVALAGTGTTGGYVEINGMFETNAAGGTVAFRWAQNTSDAGNTTVLRGSYIECQRIS